MAYWVMYSPSRREKTTEYKRRRHVVPGGKLPEGYGPTGWRGYRPNLWRDYYEACGEDLACQARVRRDYREWENGRIVEALDSLHTFLVKLDDDELKDFHRKYPNILQLVNEFATIEELRKITINEKEIR